MSLMERNQLETDFPMLQPSEHGPRLVYLDSAATTLKPTCVADTIAQHYLHEVANVHRGVHSLSEKATIAYEDSRKKVQSFLNAPQPENIIFTSGTTHSMNLVAYSYAMSHLKEGDVILLSTLEHHSNLVPWQLAASAVGARIMEIPITEQGDINLDAYMDLCQKHPVKLVACTHISNVLGGVTPIREMIAIAHKKGAIFVVDGAQGVAHETVDVVDLDCDFYAFSGHKLFGPTGVGVLYGKQELLEKMPPFFGGGSMISKVTLERSTYAPPPARFEAGTPPIAQVLGLAAAIDYVNKIGLERIAAYEGDLGQYAFDRLSQLEFVQLIGNPKKRVPVFSFALTGIHPHDIGCILDEQNIAVRTGHHCCQPLMEFFNVPATTRASFAFYNSLEDVDLLCEGLRHVKEVFS